MADLRTIWEIHRVSFTASRLVLTNSSTTVSNQLSLYSSSVLFAHNAYCMIPVQYTSQTSIHNMATSSGMTLRPRTERNPTPGSVPRRHAGQFTHLAQRPLNYVVRLSSKTNFDHSCQTSRNERASIGPQNRATSIWYAISSTVSTSTFC